MGTVYWDVTIVYITSSGELFRSGGGGEVIIFILVCTLSTFSNQ